MADFNDPWNPTLTEIRQWAFEEDAEEPCEDWDLSLLWRGHEDVYLELAADKHCPNRRFFLSMLYLMVGDKVRRGLDHQADFNLRDFISKGSSVNSSAVQRWQHRSLDLLQNPEKFNYDDWCAGGYSSNA